MLIILLIIIKITNIIINIIIYNNYYYYNNDYNYNFIMIKSYFGIVIKGCLCNNGTWVLFIPVTKYYNNYNINRNRNKSNIEIFNMCR